MEPSPLNPWSLVNFRRPVALLVSSSLLAMVAVVALPTTGALADPVKVASGWIPYWMSSPGKPAGINTAVANADLLREVSPFWFSALAGGPSGVQVSINPNFTNGAANIGWAMAQLKGAGLTVLPSIADGSGKGKMAATLADPAKRAAHVADIVRTVMANGFDGIDLDYEIFAFSDGSASWAATAPNWTSFVTELGAALHAQGKQLAVTIPSPCSISGSCSANTGYWVYNIAGISPSADRIRIMAYDYHVNGIGPIAPISWVRAIAAYAASVAGGAKVQIGVPTYGRVWTKKTAAGAYQLSGNCPSASSSAYGSLTSNASATDAEIPAMLASAGVPAAGIQWDPVSGENWVEYDKSVNWTDSTGASQTCVARRIMWWVGPEGVLLRTQLVGEFGLSAAAYWTLGGENAAQWPLIRAYAQQLAPAATEVTLTALPRVTFNTPANFSSVVTSAGVPIAGLGVTLQFLKAGTTDWANMASAATGADGSVSFTTVVTDIGQWRVYAPAGAGRAEQASDPFPVEVAALVTAHSQAVKVRAKSRIEIRVVAQPARAKQVVVVQIQRGARWRTVGRDQTNAKGVAKVRFAAQGNKGIYVYRAIAQVRGGVSPGASEPFRIRVRK